MKAVTWVLVGNPNCGKTLLFNELTGQSQAIGNWSGVTVSVQQAQLLSSSLPVQLVDLPGCYAWYPSHQKVAPDEALALQYLHQHAQKHQVQGWINVLSGADLSRQLYLTLQLREWGCPLFLVVNMMDVAQQLGYQLNIRKLQQRLGCSVFDCIAKSKKQVNQLTKRLCQHQFIGHFAWSHLPDCCQHLLKAHQSQTQPSLLIRALEGDQPSLEQLPAKVRQNCLDMQVKCRQIYQEDLSIVFAQCRYQAIDQLLNGVQKKVPQSSVRPSLDQWLLHPIWGLMIFIMMMYGLFGLTMGFGQWLQPLFEQITAWAWLFGVMPWVKGQWLQPILLGVGEGLSMTLAFWPLIFFFYFFLGWLDDAGYIARAALLMDRLMQRFHLPGRAFIAFLVGMGCNVPAMMQARTLATAQERLITAMMIPFIPCSARFAVYVALVSLFVTQGGAMVLLGLYVMGFLAAFLTGMICRWWWPVTVAAPMVLPLPNYHWPSLLVVARQARSRAGQFVRRALVYIMLASTILHVLLHLGYQDHHWLMVPSISESVLAIWLAKLNAIFTQMHWMALLSLIGGFLAKETVIGMLNGLCGSITTTHDMGVWLALKVLLIDTLANWSIVLTSWLPFTPSPGQSHLANSCLVLFRTKAALYSYLVFLTLYTPCLSTVVSMGKAHGGKWALISFWWSLILATVLALMTYYWLS
jgi:ferrous iron transport protein B